MQGIKYHETLGMASGIFPNAYVYKRTNEAGELSKRGKFAIKPSG